MSILDDKHVHAHLIISVPWVLITVIVIVTAAVVSLSAFTHSSSVTQQYISYIENIGHEIRHGNYIFHVPLLDECIVAG